MTRNSQRPALPRKSGFSRVPTALFLRHAPSDLPGLKSFASESLQFPAESFPSLLTRLFCRTAYLESDPKDKMVKRSDSVATQTWIFPLGERDTGSFQFLQYLKLSGTSTPTFGCSSVKTFPWLYSAICTFRYFTVSVFTLNRLYYQYALLFPNSIFSYLKNVFLYLSLNSTPSKSLHKEIKQVFRAFYN